MPERQLSYIPEGHNILVHVAETWNSKLIKRAGNSIIDTGCQALGKVVGVSDLHLDLMGVWVEYCPALTTARRCVLQDLDDPRYLVIFSVDQITGRVRFERPEDEPDLHMVVERRVDI